MKYTTLEVPPPEPGFTTVTAYVPGSCNKRPSIAAVDDLCIRRNDDRTLRPHRLNPSPLHNDDRVANRIPPGPVNERSTLDHQGLILASRESKAE